MRDFVGGLLIRVPVQTGRPNRRHARGRSRVTYSVVIPSSLLSFLSPSFSSRNSVCPLFFLRVWLIVRGLGPGRLFPSYRRHAVGVTGSRCGWRLEFDHAASWQYSCFRDLIQDELFKMACSNAKFVGTHSLRRGGTQLLLLLGVSLTSVRQRGFWTTYQRMETYLASNNRQELEGDLLPAPTLLAYATWSAVAMDSIAASHSVSK